jgi:hypothetical protein
MKKIIIILGLLVMSCSTNPDYQNNLKLAKKWVEAFETSNLELWKEVVSQELVDVAPMYGMGQVDYKTSLQVAEFYVQNYTDVKFENQVWLPGIDTLTMKPDGSVRAYGTWTGTITLILRMVKYLQQENILMQLEWLILLVHFKRR